MPKAVLLVSTRCTDPAREEEFNRWYDQLHIPAILKAPHFVGAQRFKVSGPPNKSEPEARYLAIYEMDTDDTGAAMKELQAALAAAPTEARAFEAMQLFSGTTYAAVSERQTA